MNEWLALEKYGHHLRTLGGRCGVMKEQIEGGAHTIRITDLASF